MKNHDKNIGATVRKCGTMGAMQWTEKEKINKKISGVDVHPIIEQLLLQRGIVLQEDVERFLAPNYDADLHDPFLFKDMKRVVKRVKKACDSGETVGVFGDHDADGVSAATILCESLEELSLNVEVYIPDKITEGHGLNETALDFFAQKGVTLLFTVDCGTSNRAEVADAQSRGMDVIITDHHHAPKVLPDAYAIINPQVSSDTYPFKELSGTAVAFKVAQAIHNTLSPEKEQQLKWLLDVVCVGTVADCMPLVGENRTLVKYGLVVLSKTRRLGYQELITAGNLAIAEHKVPSAETVAFYVAPRINAAGRMSHAKHAYALMREKDYAEAKKQAAALEEQNIERRRIVEKLTREVEKIVKADFHDKSFIVVASEDYPVGVVGIIAGRIAEKYQKPVGIFSQREGESRGSFRSIDGVHILDVLDSCAEHLVKYGGHEKAAGAIISNEHLDSFASAADKHTQKIVKENDITPKKMVDMRITLNDINFDLLQEIKKFEPFGEANEEPLFYVEGAVVDNVRMVGNGEKHMKMRLCSQDGSVTIDAIGFGLGKKHPDVAVGDVIDVVAHIQENEWMGNVTVQLNVVDIMRER